MDSPVFGSLTWDSLSHAWIGQVKLPSLAGCYRRWVAGIACRDERDAEEKRGIFTLTVFCPAGTEPNQEQIAAYTYLFENETRVTDAVMAGILQHFRDAWFEDWQREWKDKQLVERINTVAGIRETVSFIGLFVHSEAKDGQSYLGFHFGCDWHAHLSEHNLGVLMHGERVVQVGEGETASEFASEILE